MKIFISVALVLITFHAVSVQAPPDTLWTKIFGGDEPGGCEYSGDVGRSVEQTDDYGFIVTGWTNSFGHGGSDVWLLGTDKNGNELWSYAIGGENNEAGFDIRKTKDGGFIIAGVKDGNAWCLRTNELGDTLWTRQYYDTVSYDIKNIKEVSGNGFIIVGTRYDRGDDAWLARINDDGTLLWQRMYGNEFWQEGWSVDETDDGGFILVGSTSPQSEGPAKIWMIRLNELGDSLWSKTYLTGSWSNGRAVLQMNDGGFVIAGVAEQWESSSTKNSLMPAKLKNYLKQKNSMSDFQNMNNAVHPSEDELKKLNTSDLKHYNALSTQGKIIQERDAWLLRTNELGDTLWSKIVGGPGWDDIYSINPTIDGGYIIAGQKFNNKSESDDFWIIRGLSSGDTLWTTTLGDSAYEVAYDIRQTQDDGYIATGFKQNFETGVNSMWLVRFGKEVTGFEQAIDQPPGQFVLKQNYPNPFNPKTIINYQLPTANYVNLSIYNFLGQKVATLVNKKQPSGSYEVHWDAGDFASGIYIYTLTTDDFLQSKKMMLIR